MRLNVRHNFKALTAAVTAFRMYRRGYQADEWVQRSESGKYVRFRLTWSKGWLSHSLKERTDGWKVSSGGGTWSSVFPTVFEAYEYALTRKCSYQGV